MPTNNLHPTPLPHGGPSGEAEEYGIPRPTWRIWCADERSVTLVSSAGETRYLRSADVVAMLVDAGALNRPRSNWPAALGTDVRGAIRRLRREG